MDFSKVKFDDRGLVPVVVQSATDGAVLMVAWANEEALKLTEQLGECVFWSRSRQEIWHKGETSGNTMKVKKLFSDCDGDTILALVEPSGPACHTGAKSCFFNELI